MKLTLDDTLHLSVRLGDVGQRAGLPVPFNAVIAGAVLPHPTPVVASMERYSEPFVLDVSRFDAALPVLYGTDGREVGEVTAMGGTAADLVSADTDGLHVTGGTMAGTPVYLPGDKPWTVILRFKDYVYQSSTTVNWIFNTSGANLETASVSNWNQYAVHNRMSAGTTSDLQVYNHTKADGSNSVFDDAIPPSDLGLYALEYRWVNDGETLSLYVNGMKKASIPSAEAGALTDLYLTNNGNTTYSNANTLTVTDFRVLDHADTELNHVLYRWHITGFRGSDNYFQFARLCLYAGTTRLDADSGAVAAAWVDGSRPTYPNAEESAKQLTGDRSRKLCAQRGTVADIYFCIPASLPALTAYSYITANDTPARDPVSWVLEKSVDGGVTWATLDTQSGAAITEDRDTETQRFTV